MPTKNSIITANQFAISSGHQLSSQAGFEILSAGGNAVDAGVAAGIALGVLHCDLVNVAGVAPIMIRMAGSDRVITIDGLGVWPRAASVDFFETRYGGAIPEGILRTIVPAAPAAWITALNDFGTMTFGEVVSFSIRYAKEGFHAFPVFTEFIANNEDKYRRTPEKQRIYLPNGRPPEVGELFVQTDLAATLQYMADQEAASQGDRADGLKAAYDAFYSGDIAQKIVKYHRENHGLLTIEDMVDFRIRYEEPLKTRFNDIDIYCCGPWSQGISLAQTFAFISGTDFDKLGHNTPDYIHRLIETLKLVFADRERYVADPRFVDVPTVEMLNRDYLLARAELIDPDNAWSTMPPAGDPRTGNKVSPKEMDHCCTLAESSPICADTSYVCVIDTQGNMFSATPSDTSSDTEVIPGTGLCPSSRGSQSRGVSSSINCVAPGKRPRLTPNPALAVKDGKPFMTFGTPGGDVQIQAMVQMFLNVVCFGMDIQSAIEAPRFATYSFPSSFAPNDYYPGLLMIENRISGQTGADLEARGHTVNWWADWTSKAGGVCAIHVDTDIGILYAGADPRRAGSALGL